MCACVSQGDGWWTTEMDGHIQGSEGEEWRDEEEEKCKWRNERQEQKWESGTERLREGETGHWTKEREDASIRLKS